MTYTLLIFTWLGATHSVTHVDGYISLQACQSAVTQIAGPPPLRVVSFCISGPDRRFLFP
jgi:hypothetical protein